MPGTYDPKIAHIVAEDGTVFQVLNEDGTDWDEAATAKLAVQAGAASPQQDAPAS